MASFTDKFLSKLRAYLCDNSKELAQKNKISQVPYYRDDLTLRHYQWTIIDINEPGLGLDRIEMYFTAFSDVLKINGINIESAKVKEFNFEEANKILIEALNEKKITDAENRFS